MNDRPIDDSLLDLAVECALDPVRPLLGPEELEEMRKSTRFALSTHPQAQELLRRLGVRLAVQRSGAMPKGALLEALERKAAKLVGRSE